ncbi:MAG: tRNA pseudouridine(55) synthase TruB [Clostridia bacterium]|nr:tRNA pseudouridine(55) synthase TruB [Clostridia bacterium]
MTDNTLMGVICINKHQGVTSHTIVNMIRRLYNTKQVGHTGTLDPMATGVLPVMVGRAVKASEYLTAEDKGYIAEMQLGIVTDSGDITGNIISQNNVIPSYESVKSVVNTFIGTIKQTPPMYSALKVNGQKLVDLARKGIEVERKSRDIYIKSISLELIDENIGKYRLNVECSKGTYIRTLCTDIGEKLGCGAIMTSLCRTKSGNFDIKSSYTIEQLENMTEEERVSLLYPIDALFSDIEEIKLPPFFEKLAKSGLEIYAKKIYISPDSIPTGTRVRLCDENGFFALGEARDYPDGRAIKPIKQFII